MTKLRAPRTFESAMRRVIGVIELPACCAIAGVADRTIGYWTEESCSATPRIHHALAFDAAYQAAGGQDAPFLDAYAFQLEIKVHRQDACTRALVAEIATAAKEWGETVAAALVLTNSIASPLDAHRAFAEAQQAASAIEALMRRLASFLPNGVAPAAGNTGGSNA